jgi:ribonuclease HI
LPLFGKQEGNFPKLEVNYQRKFFLMRLPAALEQTNQTTEMVAMKEAAKNAGENADIRIESDSKYVINAVTKDRQKREDQGYIG